MMHLCGQRGSCYSSSALGPQPVPSAGMGTSGVGSSQGRALAEFVLAGA